MKKQLIVDGRLNEPFRKHRDLIPIVKNVTGIKFDLTQQQKLDIYESSLDEIKWLENNHGIKYSFDKISQGRIEHDPLIDEKSLSQIRNLYSSLTPFVKECIDQYLTENNMKPGKVEANSRLGNVAVSTIEPNEEQKKHMPLRNMDASEPKWAFVHVAKAGGTSINKYFVNALSEKYSAIHCEGKLSQVKNNDKLKFISGHIRYPAMKRELGDGFNYISFIRQPIEQLYSHLNWVRDLSKPESINRFKNHPENIQVISKKLYNFDLLNPELLSNFFDSMTPQETGLFDNCQTRYFLGINNSTMISFDEYANALKNIGEMLFVGIIEEQVRCLNYLAGRFNLPKIEQPITENVNKNKTKSSQLPQEIQQILKTRTNFDSLLYFHIKAKIEKLCS